MNLDDVKPGEILGIETKNGPRYYRRTLKGLSGPFADRECTRLVLDPVSPFFDKMRKKIGSQRIYVTGPQNANKQFVMADGERYHTDAQGTMRGSNSKKSKKQKRKEKVPCQRLKNSGK